MVKKGLGKGLEALFSIYDEQVENEKENNVSVKNEEVKTNGGVLEI